MANPEHLAILQQGVEVWNRWREDNLLVSPDLEGAILNSTDLRAANLRGANLKFAQLMSSELIEANLSAADLSAANLREANLSKANVVNASLSTTHLDEADLSGADLSGADFDRACLYQANLTEAKLTEVNFIQAQLTEASLFKVNLCKAYLINANLSQANLSQANLSQANLSQANFNRANLSGANLSMTNFSMTQALYSNFEKGIFTGACIQNWHINSKTNFNGVVCDYIYIENDHRDFTERRPRNPNKNFAPGEFAKLFQISFGTIDLFFQEGVDWQAFTASFLKVRAQNEDAEIEIQTIENTGDGILVKVRTTEKADKVAIEGNFWQGYELARKQLQESHTAQLEDKDKQYQSEINRLFLLVQQQSQQIVELAKQPKYDQRHSNFPGGVADTNYGTMVETQNNSQGDT